MEFTDQELRRWLWLRSIEWANWPAFLSQLVFPILVLFFWWPYVLAGVVISDLLWALVRYRFVSPKLSNIGCLAVFYLARPVAIGSSIYLFVAGGYVVAILALLWPFLAGIVCVRGQVGRIELALAKRMGYVDADVELGV